MTAEGPAATSARHPHDVWHTPMPSTAHPLRLPRSHFLTSAMGFISKLSGTVEKITVTSELGLVCISPCGAQEPISPEK